MNSPLPWNWAATNPEGLIKELLKTQHYQTPSGKRVNVRTKRLFVSVATYSSTSILTVNKSINKHWSSSIEKTTKAYDRIKIRYLISIFKFMSDNKKHHFVPRFYLKRFSLDDRSINLWNIPNSKKILEASLKNQCYKNDFYGNDLFIEKKLGSIEGNASRILNAINANCKLPHKSDNDYILLLFYITIQHGRTTRSAQEYRDLIEQLSQIKLNNYSESNKNNITINQSVQYTLKMSNSYFHLLLDLEAKLIINKTKIDFIISDNPVVLYNQFFSFRKDLSHTGYTSKGLQIFFPISPYTLILLFDKDCYGVGPKGKTAVFCNNEADVNELNILQVATAVQNIYFRNPDFPIELLLDGGTKFRSNRTPTVTNVSDSANTNDMGHDLFKASKVDLDTKLKISFIRTLRKARRWRSNFTSQQSQPVIIERNT